MKLTEGFNLLATAPDGIKRLRELILSLAVQGKLVPQDANDEPASELLKQIRDEKDRLIAEGKIRKDKPLPAISDDEKPFELPDGWEWARLGNVFKKITDGTHHSPTNVEVGDFKYISAKNIKSWGIELAGVTYVTKDVHNEIYSRCDPEFGDVLYIKDGATTGIATINTLSEPFSMLSSVALLKPSCGTLNSYLLLGMKSPYFYDSMRAGMSGVAITRVTLSKLNDAIMPLPPLAEQSRIVAKVEELMALCDALETRGALEAKQHVRLTATLFDALAASESAHQLQENWTRLAQSFDLILDRPAAVDALEQTLLQLAVRGLLVEQDPNDEPASELLKQIRAEKDRLIAEGKIKKDKPLPAISDEEKPFELPQGWEWARLDELTGLITKGSSPKWQGVEYTQDPSDVVFVTSENVRSFKIDISEPKYVQKRFNEIEPRSILKRGDYLMNIVGASIGRVAVFDSDVVANINQAVCLIRFVPSNYVAEFFLNFFNSNICLGYMFDKQVDSARPNLSMGNIAKFIIPLPPLAEQSRIVARVEALRALCADLRQRLTTSQKIQTHLAETLVEQV